MSNVFEFQRNRIEGRAFLGIPITICDGVPQTALIIRAIGRAGDAYILDTDQGVFYLIGDKMDRMPGV